MKKDKLIQLFDQFRDRIVNFQNCRDQRWSRLVFFSIDPNVPLLLVPWFRDPLHGDVERKSYEAYWNEFSTFLLTHISIPDTYLSYLRSPIQL